jgi:hypothetical protein
MPPTRLAKKVVVAPVGEISTMVLPWPISLELSLKFETKTSPGFAAAPAFFQAELVGTNATPYGFVSLGAGDFGTVDAVIGMIGIEALGAAARAVSLDAIAKAKAAAPRSARLAAIVNPARRLRPR